MSYIRKTDYTLDRERPKLLKNYLDQMVLFLKTQHPHASKQMIEGFVREIMNERCQPPMVKAIVHKREGMSEVVTKRLDHYVTDVIADNNLSPSGTCYIPASRKASFLRISIDEKMKDRSAFKKLYLNYEAQGMQRESNYYNQNQANAKIFNNAIAGGMKIKQFILGCKAGFNAITSTGRCCVKQGYSFIERAVNGNMYLPTVNDALTYALNHARQVPDDFTALIKTDVLYIPTPEDVRQYLMKSAVKYTRHTDDAILVSSLCSMSDEQLAYVFYSGCVNNLCYFNDQLMHNWIDSCFVRGNIDSSLTTDIQLSDIKKYPDDVQACMLSVNYWRLGKKPGSDTKWNSPRDAAENNPEGLKDFIYCCQYFVKQFESFLHVIRPVMHITTTFNKLVFQHRMARETVPLSDTDSNIFSMQELIRWKRGKIDFVPEAYEMNALVTFILSQSLEHVFSTLASGFGVENADVQRISMKNEFLYPILIATSKGKHYVAMATMQEGSMLPNPRKDFKGVNLRSSAYPKLVRDSFNQFIVDLMNKIQEGEPIRAGMILKHVADVEKTIYDSVITRDSDYLQTQAIRRMEDYAEPMTSVYFYYELWRDVFEKEFGEFAIPNRCYKIPFKLGKKQFKDPAFLEKLQREYPETYRKLIPFVERHNGRDMSYMLIPPFKGKIHPLFAEMMDVRSHISSIMKGYYLILEALGIGTVDLRVNGLVSDFYDPSTALLE